VSLYTRSGDDGETSLLRGSRVTKAHPRVEAIGAVDELNSVLGWCSTQVHEARVRERISILQHDLFAIGAALASGADPPRQTSPVPEARVPEMERWIDEAQDALPGLRAFILPGGAASAAALHLARTVCRRAERAMVRLWESEALPEGVLPYLNRLSDLLFVWARLENQLTGAGDVEWIQP
jgi:cob(I)alamin adenosyltransferase